MNRKRWIMGLLCGLLAACGEESGKVRLAETTPSAQSAIVGGTACTPEQFAETGEVTERDKAKCTGTLLTPDTVLTAAHCVVSYPQRVRTVTPAAELAYKPGDHVSRPRTSYAVRRVEIHGGYRGVDLCTDQSTPAQRRACDKAHVQCDPIADELQRATCLAQLPRDVRVGIGAVGPRQLNDVALLYLKEPIPDATLARLLPPWLATSLDHNTTVDIVGYGLSTPLMIPQLAVKRWGSTHMGDMGDHELVTKPGDDNSHACHGDSGGPLMLQKNPNAATPGARTQIGIASRISDYDPRVGCATGLIYTRVDAYLPWIMQHMAKSCDRGERAGCDMPELVGFHGQSEHHSEGCAVTGVGLWVAVAVGLLMLKYRRQP